MHAVLLVTLKEKGLAAFLALTVQSQTANMPCPHMHNEWSRDLHVPDRRIGRRTWMMVTFLFAETRAVLLGCAFIRLVTC